MNKNVFIIYLSMNIFNVIFPLTTYLKIDKILLPPEDISYAPPSNEARYGMIEIQNSYGKNVKVSYRNSSGNQLQSDFVQWGKDPDKAQINFIKEQADEKLTNPSAQSDLLVSLEETLPAEEQNIMSFYFKNLNQSKNIFLNLIPADPSSSKFLIRLQKGNKKSEGVFSEGGERFVNNITEAELQKAWVDGGEFVKKNELYDGVQDSNK